jgi:hypothetical protein
LTAALLKLGPVAKIRPFMNHSKALAHSGGETSREEARYLQSGTPANDLRTQDQSVPPTHQPSQLVLPNGGHRSRHAAHAYGIRDQQGSQRIDRDCPAHKDHYPPSEHSLDTVNGLIDAGGPSCAGNAMVERETENDNLDIRNPIHIGQKVGKSSQQTREDPMERLPHADTSQEDRGGRPRATDENAGFNRNGAKLWPLFGSRPRRIDRGVRDVERGRSKDDGDKIFDKIMRRMKELGAILVPISGVLLVQLQKMWTTIGGVLVAVLWVINITGGMAFFVAKNNSGYESYENWYVDEGGKRSSFG